MKVGYNIYYKGNLINNKVLNIEDLNNVYKHNYIYKKNKYYNTIEKIPVSNLKIVKTILV